MPDYELTPDAEVDLHDIALYTLKTWGIEQTNRYEAALENNLTGIGAGETRTTPVFEHRSDLRVCAESITLATLEKVAHALGKVVHIELS